MAPVGGGAPLVSPFNAEPSPSTSSISCEATANSENLLGSGLIDEKFMIERFRLIVPSGCPGGGSDEPYPSARASARLIFTFALPLTGLLAVLGRKARAVVSSAVVA